MRAHHWLAVALFLLLLALISSIALADGVTISDEPRATAPASAEAAQPLVLEMAPGETTATFSLYLRNTTTSTLENLDLFAYLENARGQTLPGVGLQFLNPTDDQPLDDFSLAAEGQRHVRLQVENLTAFGTFTGTISLQQTRTISPTTETTLQVLATFRLDKPGQPKIAVQGADAEGNISHTASTSEADLHLELLEENGQVGVDDLVISLSAEAARSDGAAAAPGVPQAAALTWSSEGATEGPLSLPAHGRRTLTLHATLPEVTTYRGTLDLQYGDQLERYTLLITRAAPGAVTARPAQDDGTVALSVPGTSFNRTVTLELPQGQPAVQDLVVSLVDLEREDGPMAPTTTLDCSLCDGQAHLLEAARPLKIAITGRGLEPGTYLAGLLLSQANGPQTIPLRITRSALAANLDLAQPETGDGINRLWFGGATVDVKAIVTEKEGRATQIYYPTIELVSRQDQKGRTYSVSGEKIERQEASGKWVSVSPANTLETVDLPGQQQATFVYRVRNLNKAGTYSGKIRVLGPDSTAVEKTFTITVKDAWLYAFLTILLGVTLSFLLRQWRRAGRARNLRAADIARLEIVIQGQRDEAPGDAVWIYLSDALQWLQKQNRIEGAMTEAEVDTALERLGQRQEIYQDALAAREQIGRLLQGYPTEGDLAKNKHRYEKEAKKLFEDLQEQLCQEDSAGLGNNEAPATRDSLQAKRDEIEVATVKDPAKQLQEQVKALVAEVEADRLSDGLKVKANTLRAEVDKIVTAVDVKDPDIKALAKELDTQIDKYADLRLDQLDELLRRLDAQQDAASQVTDWGAVDERQATARKHYDRARNQATAAGKLDEWEQGRHHYLGAAIAFLSILVAQPSPGIKPDEWELLLADVPDLQPNLREADVAWKLASPLAEAVYGRAREEYLKLLVEVLRKRIAATRQLVGQMPGFVEPDDWPDIEGNLKPSLAELDKVKDALPAADAKPDERRTGYQDARQKYLLAQVQALEAGHTAMNAYYEKHKDEHENEPLWATTKAELPKIVTAIAAAKAAKDRFNAGGTEEALLEAEKAARQAEGQYADSLEACAASGARDFGPAVAAPIALVLGLASAAASIPAALAGGLSVPSREAFEEKKRRAYRPKPPGYYFGRILRNDLIASLVALAVASISGLLALWAGETAFGGVLYISAFLWGFGFSEATTAAADVLTHLGVEKP